MNDKPRVCESCREAASEEGMATEDEYGFLCLTFGAEIGDHLCEEIETDGLTTCDCTCHPSAKQELRRAANPRVSR